VSSWKQQRRKKMNEKTIDFIYALVETQSRTKFYIGRTIDPERRLTEHRSGSKNYKPGDELKYLYASQLDALSIKWEMEILQICGPDTDGYEDFYVNLYRDSPLMNMRAGDSEPWNGRDYASPEEYLAAKRKLIEEAKKVPVVKVKRIRDLADTDRTIMHGQNPETAFMSEGLREIMNRRKK
jgi:predicted GIY-YIG superfamily endonuclease